MSLEKKIICTLGPSSMNPKTISKLEKYGVSLFRINLSHTPLDKVKNCVEIIQSSTEMPICLDTEGAQVRTKYMKNDNIVFQEGSTVKLHQNIDFGDESNLCFSPTEVHAQLKEGDLLSVDFDTVQLKIIKKTPEETLALVLCGGKVGHNKAVTVNRELNLTPLSPKDVEAVKIGMEMNVDYVALSFANKKSDVEFLRSLIKPNVKIISKIESTRGLENLDDILDATDSILIDRGDLSREQHIEKIPFLQKEILKRANEFNKPAYVATNLLESMVTNKKPTRAEVNDVISTIISGASGLVLAAETAIGKYPTECVFMINKLIKSYTDCKNAHDLNELIHKGPKSFYLPAPCGNQLVDRVNLNASEEELTQLKVLNVNKKVLIDLEQIAVGTYSPLEGFCTQTEINSILENYTLPDGTVWTLPILLQVFKSELNDLKVGDRVALASEEDGTIYGFLDLEDINYFDFEYIAEKLYGTLSLEHPGVELLKDSGEVFLGGKVTLTKFLPSKYRAKVFTPKETRMIFEHKGWSQVAGFHTRNVAHKGHEYLQKKCLERIDIDGIFIHPVIGQKKKGDYETDIIIETYEIHIDENLGRENVLFGAFNTYSRYAGPREAIFTALCRKNYGCSHFVIGRDHTGVGSFYPDDGARILYEKIGDIGISLIFFDKVSYCPKREEYVEGELTNEELESISATKARKFFEQRDLPPKYLMSESTSAYILKSLKAGKSVFL